MNPGTGRAIFRQLALWGLQLALSMAWLLRLGTGPGWRAEPGWWAAAVLAVFLGLGMLCWYGAQTYRVLLWRRRKSVRPSPQVQAERRRIAAALHDGLGSQLVQASALVERGHSPVLAQLLEQCLLDLRLIVDSMDTSDDEPLSLSLARYRHRLQSVLAHRGIALHWDVWDPQLQGEGGSLPQGAVAQHIMAVLQEAVSNILQHAEARNIWITLTPAQALETDRRWASACLHIEDDGRGWPDALHRDAAAEDAAVEAGQRGLKSGAETGAARGMGLNNMARRAEEIGARLDCAERVGGGCRVSLRW